MTHEEVAVRIETFVRTQFEVARDDADFGPETSLFLRGYVDSLGVAELIAFLEEAFGVIVPDEDLLSDEFDTIQGIARIVLGLRDRAGPAAPLEVWSGSCPAAPPTPQRKDGNG
jgi:acyl carrier protein